MSNLRSLFLPNYVHYSIIKLVLVGLKVIIIMTTNRRNNITSRPEAARYSSEELQLKRLWTLTDSVFKQKNLDISNAHEFTKYMGWHYNFLVQDGKIGESNEFLAMYEAIMHAIESLEDQEILDKIEDIISNFMENIDKIYEDSRDIERYGKGVEIMFKVLFRCFTSTKVAEALDEDIRESLATILLALEKTEEETKNIEENAEILA